MKFPESFKNFSKIKRRRIINSAIIKFIPAGMPVGLTIIFEIAGNIVNAIRIRTTEIIFFVKHKIIFFVIFKSPSKHTKKPPIKRAVYRDVGLYDLEAMSPTRSTVAGPDRIGNECPNNICKKSDSETINESFCIYKTSSFEFNRKVTPIILPTIIITGITRTNHCSPFKIKIFKVGTSLTE